MLIMQLGNHTKISTTAQPLPVDCWCNHTAYNDGEFHKLFEIKTVVGIEIINSVKMDRFGRRFMLQLMAKSDCWNALL